MQFKLIPALLLACAAMAIAAPVEATQDAVDFTEAQEAEEYGRGGYGGHRGGYRGGYGHRYGYGHRRGWRGYGYGGLSPYELLLLEGGAV